MQGRTSQSRTPKPYTSTALLILPSLISSGGMCVICSSHALMSHTSKQGAHRQSSGNVMQNRLTVLMLTSIDRFAQRAKACACS